jgi:lysozyme
MTPDDQVRLRSQLKRDEGCVLYYYADSMGYASLGYGRMIDHRKGGGISESEAEYLLDNDIVNVTFELSPFSWFAVQDSVRQAALANMTFNLGIQGLLYFPQFLLHMGAKEYDQAVMQLVNTPWHKEVGARADRIMALISTGNWP